MPAVELFALVGLQEARLAGEAIADDRNREVSFVIGAIASDEARLDFFHFPVFVLNDNSFEEADALNLLNLLTE